MKSKKRCRGANQEMRKGSSKLLKTLIIKLSLVTDSICGPGNCPLINIPCSFGSKALTFQQPFTLTWKNQPRKYVSYSKRWSIKNKKAIPVVLLQEDRYHHRWHSSCGTCMDLPQWCSSQEGSPVIQNLHHHSCTHPFCLFPSLYNPLLLDFREYWSNETAMQSPKKQNPQKRKKKKIETFNQRKKQTLCFKPCKALYLFCFGSFYLKWNMSVVEGERKEKETRFRVRKHDNRSPLFFLWWDSGPF